MAKDKKVKKKDKKPKDTKKNSVRKITEMKNVDEGILSQAIVKAYFEIEKKKREEEQISIETKQREWLTVIGQKEYPDNEKWYKKKWHSFKNGFICFWRLMFINSKTVKDMRATFALMSIAVTSIFALLKWFLYIVCIALIVLMVKKEIGVILGMAWAFILWMFARVFRIAIYEIQGTKDGNLLTAIFSGVLSFVAVVIAIIAIVVEV